MQEPHPYVRAARLRRERKTREGGVGMDDLSHAGDAAGYALYRLAAIRQWRTGSSKSVRVW